MAEDRDTRQTRLAARTLSHLLSTPDDELDEFRERRLGSASAVDDELLIKTRELLDAIDAALRGDAIGRKRLQGAWEVLCAGQQPKQVETDETPSSEVDEASPTPAEATPAEATPAEATPAEVAPPMAPAVVAPPMAPAEVGGSEPSPTPPPSGRASPSAEPEAEHEPPRAAPTAAVPRSVATTVPSPWARPPLSVAESASAPPAPPPPLAPDAGAIPPSTPAAVAPPQPPAVVPAAPPTAISDQVKKKFSFDVEALNAIAVSEEQAYTLPVDDLLMQKPALPYHDSPDAAEPPPAVGLNAEAPPAGIGDTATGTPIVDAKALPFEAAATSPAQGDAPDLPAHLESVTLEQYAALCAQCAVHTEWAGHIEARYQIQSPAERRALDRYWQAKLAADDSLQQAFRWHYTRYESWARSQREQ